MRTVGADQDGATRAAIYLRVSSEKQVREGLSLQAQEMSARKEVAHRDWRLTELYREAGVSGRKDSRPQLDAMFAAAERGEFDVLVIPKLDRLGRSVKQLANNFARLDDAGVKLVSLSESIDTGTVAGRLLRNMLASIAEFETDRLAERIRDVNAVRAAQGKPHGRPPYGYRVEDGERLVVDEDEAVIVRRIFAEYAEGGLSQQAITRRLNADGIRTRQGGTWSQGTLSKILRARYYIGDLRVSGGEWKRRPDGGPMHELIVSEETWRKAQDLRNASQNTAGGRRGGRPTNGSHLFTKGMLRCGVCESSMVARSDRVHSYYCYRRKTHGPEACSMPPLPRALVDDAVRRYFEEVGLDVDRTRRDLEATYARQLAEARSLRASSLREAEAAEARLDRVRDDYTDGKLPAEEWLEFKTDLTAGRDAARAEAQRHADRERELEVLTDTTDLEEATLRDVAHLRAVIAGEVKDTTTVEALRAALRRLFDGFTVHYLDEDAQREARATAPTWWEPSLFVPGFYLEPHAAAKAISSAAPAGYEGETIFPTFRKVGLATRLKSDATPFST